MNISNQTLLATTHLREGDIDMDQQKIPKMNCKKRGLPSAQQRLEGRTNFDILFLSIKSFPGFRCDQLFVHLLTHFLWIANPQKEKDNHGAYQDYIREVGTPNILLTGNSKNQTVRKWTETSQNNQKQQIMSAPDKQNQNASEQKINDIKHRVYNTLFASQSPIIFWYYCMPFFVYCLNLRAWCLLNYRTYTEALTGHTPDIFHLKFTFCSKPWYYDYNGKFP